MKENGFIKEMEIRAQEEDMTRSLFDEICDIAQSHADEVLNMQGTRISPSWRSYRQLVRSGFLRVYTMREGLDLVGYGLYILNRSPHLGKLIACQDMIYIEPESRKGDIGYRFLKYIEQSLIQSGAEIIYQNSPMKHDIGRIFERMGYGKMQETWGKVVR